MNASDIEALRLENAELLARLEEAESTLAAIRGGDVDALVVGDHVYTLDSANASSNTLRKDVLAQMEDAVVAFDDDDHVVYMNAAAARQYRKTDSEALGRSRFELFTESWADSKAEAAAREALREQGSYRANSIHTRVDGSVMHVEATVSRLRDAVGRAIGYLSVIRDISDRVRAEKTLSEATDALARRERQFATLVENSPDILTRLDRDLRHRYVSPIVEHYTGLRPADYIGKTHAELGVPAELCERWRLALRQVFETGVVGRTKFSFDAVTGEACVFDCRLVPEFGDDGVVESVLSIASDVTEQAAVDAARRLAEESLRDADRRKDEFLATLAHELRNPLAPIRNAVRIMRLTHEPATQENARGIIERQLLQMVHLVDDLLDVSRISLGKVELRLEHVDVGAVVQAAIETSRPLIDAGRHELVVRLPAPRTLMVGADLTRLTQILANLLNNAAKYTSEGGRIEIGAERSGSDAVITVQDSGIGIPTDMLPKVFDMFAQVDRRPERSQGGLGIGLALVKQLVDLHGGTVCARSEGLGRGSSFEVRIPLVQPEATGPSAPQATEKAEPATDFRVLVVDDNVDNAESLASVLRLVGYQTCTAYDGKQALSAAADYRPHAVLLDIGLPLLSGLEVAHRLRATSPASSLTLIAISGWGQEADRARSSAAGFDHHFVKPVDIEALIALLARVRA